MKKLLASLLVVMLISSACAQTEEKRVLKFKEGEHYEVVSENRSKEQKLTEFFSHYCGHCFQFEKYVDSIKMNIGKAEFEKSHASYIPQSDSVVAMSMVKAFIIMQDLGIEKTVSPQIFEQIHVERNILDSEQKIKDMFLQNGVSSEKYDELYTSESVNKRAKEMSELWMERKITSVPTFVVNDKYKINMGSITSLAQLQELIDELFTLD